MALSSASACADNTDKAFGVSNFSTIPHEQTCFLKSATTEIFMMALPKDRFNRIIFGKKGQRAPYCEGELQYGRLNEIPTVLRTVFPGWQINVEILGVVEDILSKIEGWTDKGNLEKRYFVFKPMKNWSGLPSGELTQGLPQASTMIDGDRQTSFTTIPLVNDGAYNWGALGTEICQTNNFGRSVTDRCEVEEICNSFGAAVEAAFNRMNYSLYHIFLKKMKINRRGCPKKNEPLMHVSDPVYANLKRLLGGFMRPNILIPKTP